MLNQDALNWYVLYVAYRCEKSVAAQLEKKGYATYVPIQRQVRQWSDRRKQLDVVLFPNYVFLGLANGQGSQSALDDPNVRGFVQFGGQPTRLTPKEVQLIQQIGISEHPVEIYNGTLAPGDEVEIISGNLKHYRGRILAINGTARVQLAIPSLQCFAQVVVGRGEVRSIVK